MSARADFKRFSPEERLSFLGYRFGSTLDFVNLILAEVGYPVEVLRWFVDAVQGICKGREKRIAHETLARRAMKFKNRKQAQSLTLRAIEANAEWSVASRTIIFDIERPKPGEREGKDKRARTRYTDYLTLAAVFAQERLEAVKRADELRWKKDWEYRLAELRKILGEALKKLPAFERVEDMPTSVKPKGQAPQSLSEYVERREQIALAEVRRIHDRLKSGEPVDADEIDERLAVLEVTHARVVRQVESEYESTRSALLALRSNRCVRAMDFTDPEEVAADVDSKLAPDAETAEARAAEPTWLDEVTNKGIAGDTLSDTPDEVIPTATYDSKGIAGDTLRAAMPEGVSMVEWALFWALEVGIPVFPMHEILKGGACSCTCSRSRCKGGRHRCGANCKSKAKHSRIFEWEKNASRDPEQIRRWWAKWPSANIGGLMGGEGRFVALDTDPKNKGDASFADLVEKYGDGWLDTLTNRTGSLGNHFLFEYPEDVPMLNTSSEIGPGIDTRGEGGCIVLPPSMHSSGRRYEVVKVAPINPAPEWLVDFFRAKAAGERPKVADFQEEQGRRTFAASPGKGSPFHDGGRNTGLFGVGIGRWRHGWAADESELCVQLYAVNGWRCVPPLDAEEVEDIAAHIARDYSHLRGVDAAPAESQPPDGFVEETIA